MSSIIRNEEKENKNECKLVIRYRRGITKILFNIKITTLFIALNNIQWIELDDMPMIFSNLQNGTNLKIKHSKSNKFAVKEHHPQNNQEFLLSKVAILIYLESNVWPMYYLLSSQIACPIPLMNVLLLCIYCLITYNPNWYWP